MKFLIIIMLILVVVLLYKNKEGLVDYTKPLDKSSPIYGQMRKVDTDDNVKMDLRMFNNTPNLLYGWQRMPTL